MVAEPYVCDLDTETNSKVYIYLFNNISEECIPVIRENVLSGEWKCAVVKPTLIIDPFQIVIAVNKAMISHKNETLKTKSPYTEILFNLSMSSNISQSLKTFGMENDTDILFVFIINELFTIDMMTNILNRIKGNNTPLSQLGNFSNRKAIKKEYKLTDRDIEEISNKCLTDILASKICIKSFLMV